MPHQILLLKLKAHGIGDSIIDWIEQWLADRKQRRWRHFKLEISFEWVTTRIRVRTFIFLNIYISDLDDNITSNVLKFADDTKVFRKVNTDGDKKTFTKLSR